MPLPRSSRRSISSTALVALLSARALTGCTGASTDIKQGGAGGADSGDTGDTGTIPDGCRADGGDPDKDRAVLVAFPYTAGGGQADAWGAWSLNADALLMQDSRRLDLGRAAMGEMVFTPDGQIGLAPLEDGSLLVYDAEAGTGSVLAEGSGADLYAERVVMEPSGERAWIIDGNWAENGGGVYPVDIDCIAPTVTVGDRWLPAKLPADLLLLDGSSGTGGRVVIGREVPGASRGDDLALVDADGTWIAGADAFGDDDAIVSDAALTLDGQYILIADISEFSGVPTRVAVVALAGDTLTPVQIIDVEDPVDLEVAPDDDRVVVVSGYANALFSLDRTDDPGSPFRLAAEPDWLGTAPQLPGAAVQIRRGSLRGHLLVSETEGVRQVDILGGVTDRGVVATGGIDGIAGSIGVQP